MAKTNPEKTRIWQRNEIQSPCVQICVIHPETRLCTGCNRSIDEITNWSKMSPAQRAAILEELGKRQAAPQKRRGGRAARLAK